MKGQLPKAYLRIDPNLDQTHPDPGLFVRLLCAGARQPRRGLFKDRAVFVGCLGKRASEKLLARGDVDVREDGAVVIDGWDIWQEGDLLVGERLRQIRCKREGVEPGPPPPKTPGAYRTANWRLRKAVFERDSYTCRYCGKADYDRDWLVTDHLIPQPHGPTTLANLVTACRPCNKQKGDKSPEEAGMRLLALCDASHASFGDASPSEAVGGRRKAVETNNDNGTDSAAKPRVTWLTPYAEAWKTAYGGEPRYGQIAKAFKALHDKHGPGEVLSRWVRYLAETEAAYASPSGFASKFGAWAVGSPGTALVPFRAPPLSQRATARRGAMVAAISGGLKGDGTVPSGGQEQ